MRIVTRSCTLPVTTALKRTLAIPRNMKTKIPMKELSTCNMT